MSSSRAPEPLFFRSSDHPLPVGHLASLSFSQTHPDGLVTLYEMILTWVPHNECLPACRITATRGFGSISRFAKALFHVYSPEASPHLLALLSEFPEPSDGPTHPYKVDYRMERMQRYFDCLFGFQAPINSDFVLDDPRITPEFFAFLAKDQDSYISRKKAWGEWQCTLQRKQEIVQHFLDEDQHSKANFAHEKVTEYEDDILMSKIMDSGCRVQRRKSQGRSKKISKKAMENEDTDVNFSNLNHVFALAPVRPLPCSYSSTFAVEVFAPDGLFGNSVDDISLAIMDSASSTSANRPSRMDTCSFHSSHTSEDISLFGTPNTSVWDLAYTLLVVNPQEQLSAKSRISSEATLSKLGLKGLRPSDKNVISLSLTTRFYFETIRVLVDFTESIEKILSRIYVALQLPFNSRKLKGNVWIPGPKHVGAPNGKENGLKGKEAFMKWMAL